MSQPPSQSRRKSHPQLPQLELGEGAGLIAGVDEAGRGPLAGPVVAAAVILHDPRRILDVRVDDSKRLTALQRQRAYRVILQNATVGIGIVPADVIDEDNIRQATLQAMVHAVADLTDKPVLVLVDGNDPPPLEGIRCRTIIDGDHLSYPIACASIIAKVTRDRLMRFYHRLFPAYGFSRHKGYGTDLHQRNLQTHGPSFLHRMTFAPVAGNRSRVTPEPGLRAQFVPPTATLQAGLFEHGGPAQVAGPVTP